MSKLCRWGMLCVMGLALSAPLALAGEEGEGGGEGRARRGGEFRKRMAERRKAAQRMRAFRGLNMPLGASENARAELKRHRTALEELIKAVQALRADVKKATEAGADEEAAIKANLEKAKMLAGRVVAEYSTHLANMSKVAQEEGEAVVEKLAGQLLKGEPDRPRGGRRPEARDRRAGEGEKKEGPADVNPFND